MSTLTEQQQAIQDEKARNEMNFGKHLTGYITYQLAIDKSDVETVKTIERISAMSYAQLQKFDIQIIPVADEFFKIKGYRVRRVLKNK